MTTDAEREANLKLLQTMRDNGLFGNKPKDENACTPTHVSDAESVSPNETPANPCKEDAKER